MGNETTIPWLKPYLPIIMPIVNGQLRTWVAVFGTYLATYGVTVSGEDQEQIAGAVLVLLALVLSGVQKWWAERKKRRAEVSAAVASADAGSPVTVTVTAAGLPNEAVRVSKSEAAAAPSVPSNVPPSPAPHP